MAVNTVQNISLSLELDGVEFNCQVIDATLTLPGVSPGQTTETACPAGVVSEPGTTTNGSLSGSVFADPSDTGITWILATAYKAGAEMDYVVVYWPDLGAAKAIEFTGKAKVNTFALPFTKPGISKHALDLSLITADMARPAAV